jgi:hypothetical protein
MIEQHRVDLNDPRSRSQARYTNEVVASKVSEDLVLENHEALKGIEDFFINYTSSEEVYDRNTIIANLCFSTVIAENLLNDPYPKTMSECKNCSDWNK